MNHVGGVTVLTVLRCRGRSRVRRLLLDSRALVYVTELDLA